MKWQDWVIGFCQVLFFLMLLPMLWEPVKPPLLTSLGTGFALTASAAAVGSLGVRWGAASMMFVAGIWFGLAFLRVVG